MKSLIVVIVIASFLRFFQLDVNPPSLTWDEVAWGYNAYSLGIDGKDEFGQFLPLTYIESFGDFKPPLYAYLSIIPVTLFGLNEFAVRFPSALFGVLTVIATYFLVKNIFPQELNISFRKGKISVALVSAFLLAISPWHINLSRAAFEANVASFFIVCGVWLFLAAISGKRKRPYILILSGVSFVLSLYTFNTARIVSPLLVIFLSIGFWNKLMYFKKQTFFAAAVGIVIVAPLVPFLLSPQASLRFKEVNIFSESSIIDQSNQEIANDGNSIIGKIIHNRRVLYAIQYINHYFDHLTPKFLFISGDGNPKFSTQDVGQLYLWEFPFLIAGLLFLFKRREGNWWIIPLWLVLGIIPAATARETPHALRIETTLPTFQILTAYGLMQVLIIISSFHKKILNIQLLTMVVFVLSMGILFNFLYYFHGYYAHYPREYSGEWQYGYKDAISYVQKNINQYDSIFITESLGRPYAYVLFYTKYNPKEFRKMAVVEREVFGFVHVKKFGKFQFNKDITKLPSLDKTLYIDSPGRVPGSADIKQTFYLLNGEPILVAYTR